MSLTNDLTKLANSANVLATAITVNSTAITAISVGGYTINTSGMSINSTSTNTFTVGTGSYFVANGNVGIGTASPATYGSGITTIDVEGTNGGGIKFGTGSASYGVYLNSTAGYVQTFNSTPIIVATNNVERMRIDASGNVGIGTTSPATKLNIYSSTAQNDGIGFVQIENPTAANAVNASYTAKNYSGTSQFMQWENYGLRIGSRIKTNSGAGAVVFTYGNDLEGMRIESSGSLLIGSTNDYGKLFVSQAANNTCAFFNLDATANVAGLNCIRANVNLTTQNILDLEYQGVSKGTFSTDGTNIKFNSAAVSIFSTASTERMRIAANGNIGINTGVPDAQLRVDSNGVINCIYARSEYGGMTHFLVGTSISTAGGSDALGVYDAGGLSARISTNGYYTSRPNSYGATSDIKLKENIVDSTPKLADLLKVRIRNFNYIDDPNLKQIGVIAQEMEDIFPGLVYETQDRSVDGTDLGTTTKNVKYSVFIPMLIKSIQELSAINAAFEARLAILENNK